MPRRSAAGPTVALAGSLPRPEFDGLSAIADELLDQPRKLYIGITVYTVSKRTENLLKDTYYPVVMPVQIEVPQAAEDQKLLGEILGRALAKRTGMLALPFEPGAEYHHGGAVTAAEEPGSETETAAG